MAIAVVVCLFARPLGRLLGVLDNPDEARKSHIDPTPLVGGIAVLAPFVLWAGAEAFFGPASDAGFHVAILLCGGGVAVLGFMDDQQGISAGGRLLLIAIFSIVALRLDPVLIPDRLHLAGRVWLSMPPLLLAALSVFALAGFSSAVNMSDGLNGLVLAFVCIWSFCLVVEGGPEVSEAASVIGSASLVALFFNVRGRLFLGDCGAFALAFIVGLLALRSHNRVHLPIETALVWFYLPVLDCLRMIVIRLRHGRSPFEPDREHFHHRLAARLGQPWALVTYAIVVASTSLVATLVPQLALSMLAAASALFFGFLLGDGLAARAVSGRPLPLSSGVFALDKQLAKGP